MSPLRQGLRYRAACDLPPNVLLWIINFLSSKTQAVSSFGQISGWLPITQSIIQGSGIGPYLYINAKNVVYHTS